MRKIRIAQIGIGHDHAITIRNLHRSDAFELVGYALPEAERRDPAILRKKQQFSAYPELSLDEVLRDETIEAVSIEAEELSLTACALAAAERKKAIHMDKPGGILPADFDRLIDLVRQNGTVFHVGYMYRYNPYIRDLLARIRNGELGEILSVEAQMNCCHTPEKRQWLSRFPGGMMFFLGCHLVDLILQIQGAPDRIVPFNCSTGTDGVTADDFGMAVLCYPRGVSFAKTSAVETGGFARRQLVVSGTKATVELKPLELHEQDPLQFTGRTVYQDKTNWEDRGVYEKSPLFDRYDAMLEAFAAMVRGERENPYSYEYERLVYHTTMRCCGVEPGEGERA